MRQQKIRTLIVDGEPIAREMLRLRLEREPGFEVVAEAQDGNEAIRSICEHQPDLVFLDVELPGMNGFEVIEEIKHHVRPQVVFVTALEEFAAKAFAVGAVDYLLKPINPERFHTMYERVQNEFYQRGTGAGREPDTPGTTAKEQTDRGALTEKSGEGDHGIKRLIVKKNDRYIFVPVEAVNWIESAGNYVRIHVDDGSYILRSTMADMEDKLDESRFCRIHRQHIVNIDRVAEVEPAGPYGDFDVLLDTGSRLRMSRTYRSNLLP